jgi:hypothetical protein
VTFRSSTTNDYYPTASDKTSDTYLSQSDKDYSQQRDDSYLLPTTNNNQQRTIVGNRSDQRIPLVKQNNSNQPSQITNESNIPRVGIKTRAPIKRAPSPPATKRDESGDSYV